MSDTQTLRGLTTVSFWTDDLAAASGGTPSYWASNDTSNVQDMQSFASATTSTSWA